MPQRNAESRIQRVLKQQREQAEALGAKAEYQLERNLVRKLARLALVWRFVTVWVVLCFVLIGSVVVQTRALGGYYQSMQPAPGGIYREGIIGTYTNANPLYVTGQVNDAVSKLLFASLFTYDDRNRLIGDLAESYAIDPTETVYTVKLRPNLTWHDGKPLTAEDVVFTYHTIQNPDAQSPLNVSWQNVTVAAKDPRTVIFTLPNPLSSFPYSLTTGIIPKHSFESVNVANYRSLSFNTVKPVGAGPYVFKTIEVNGNSPSTRQEEIELVPFKGYHGETAAIASFIVHTYPNEESLLADFNKHELTAMVGLQDVPEEIAEDKSVQEVIMPLAAANMVFFKTTDGVLADKAVRQALAAGVDVKTLTRSLHGPVLPVRSPLLPGTPGFDPALQQVYVGVDQAAALLDKNGWLKQADGIRRKNGQALAFKLYAQDIDEYEHITKGLQAQWKRLGADVNVYLQEDADLRSTVTDHSYDALLYGISLGVDPDGFVYWHSSQADVRSPSRLNFSEYKSDAADASLEAGRTRSDPVLRAIKYKPFLQAWKEDAPALGLYQPRFLYVTHGEVYGLNERTLVTDTDRFNNVNKWMIRREAQTIR